ncbi:hypothetical protein EMIHUDRAFT_200602 [Emiliania huxleyi CCMP1516]|uniref:DOMON domain-containing protein n=2 Tax=Emiliania huxleyi TaxID=2903 RepID=A0A0D3KQU5_EMIH1|nr:hypothetical protein EMIHUDRAFT_200602 [Emiliania huxleyi CCMP1516]EOD38130.1 hypothetical protein EMIHUDRAFT_200602 [Emiliania huxleyi CCMP1516]|eukprot:XP_005790559.1 hypothetical protein EMIHUDRAFT_200602 [Emiliania huxleyi CCMP1516]
MRTGETCIGLEPQRSLLAWLAAWLVATPLVSAGFDTFSVKSINIGSADQVEFYALEGTGVEDAHPVYGFEASDGSFIFCGKGLESESSSEAEAFAVKFSSTGQTISTWRSNHIGKDAANACAQLPGGGDVLVVGYRLVGGVAYRSMTKLSLATLAETWTATTFGDSSGQHGAWEGIDFSTDGATALLAGFYDKSSADEMSFRSYGNTGGKAVVMALPVTVLSGASAPTASSASWTAAKDDRHTAKAVRPLSNGDMAVLFWKDSAEGEEGTDTAVAKLSATGGFMWGPIDVGSQHGEGTELAVAVDESAVFISGHGGCLGLGGFCGKLTKIRATDGVVLWSRAFSSCGSYDASGVYTGDACGNNMLIKTECWGVQAMNDGGLVLACGTGIEDCSGMQGQMAIDCANGIALLADSRAGAFARSAGVWQSFVVRTDASGALLWQRTDQYRMDGEPALGTPGWEEGSSASEYVAKTADGGLLFVNDEANGVGGEEGFDALPESCRQLIIGCAVGGLGLCLCIAAVVGCKLVFGKKTRLAPSY